MTRETLSHPLSIAGALATTASAAIFIALVIAMVAGLLTNPYAGLVVFLLVPLLFVIGLLLIPLGVHLRRRALRHHPEAVSRWPLVDLSRPGVRRTALIITALTGVNIVIVLLAGYGGLHWMESPAFCGQVCHAPMHPQFSAWNGATHARVACVSCHIGEGARGFVHAKLSGVRQLVDVTTNAYPRPIPPGAHMPPGAQAQTCTNCHQPGRTGGDRIRVVREYADDEKNSETLTVLHMHVDAGTASPRAIHWHANPRVRVEYVATDEERQTIPYVKVTDAKGQVKEYVAPETNESAMRTAGSRTMDCIDCHNTVGHPISPTPERAVDEAIANARISRDLPFARREGVRLIGATYASQEAAERGIDQGMREFYTSKAGSVDQEALGRSVAALQELYRRNVFPAMKVTWGSYPTNKGHVTSTGCFRCHDGSHTAEDGSTIGSDCEYCHTQIERP